MHLALFRRRCIAEFSHLTLWQWDQMPENASPPMRGMPSTLDDSTFDPMGWESGTGLKSLLACLMRLPAAGETGISPHRHSGR